MKIIPKKNTHLSEFRNLKHKNSIKSISIEKNHTILSTTNSSVGFTLFKPPQSSFYSKPVIYINFLFSLIKHVQYALTKVTVNWSNFIKNYIYIFFKLKQSSISKETLIHSFCIFYIFSIGISVHTTAHAQDHQVINLNTENGLPSNLVYGIITDRNGYLWICTDKGVVRYNGYECKLFNISNGLPTEDIWELIEDKKGRIWLGSISDEIGYIYKNKYHRAFLKDNKESIYPKHIRRLGDGIIFESGFLKNFGIFFEKNDTIHSFYAKDIFSKQGQSFSNNINDSAIVLIDELGTPIGIFNGKIYHIEKNQLSGKLECNLLSEIENTIALKYQDMASTIIGNNIVSYYPNHNTREIYLTNINTGQVKIESLKIPKTDFLKYLYPEKKSITNNTLYIITNSNILKCEINNNINIIDSYAITSFIATPDKNLMISTVHKSPLHGYCIGTTSTGAWIKQTGDFDLVKKRNLSLENYTPVGCHNNSMSFWWNKPLKTLAVIDHSSITKYKNNNLNNVKFVKHYAHDTFFVGSETPWLFAASSETFIPLKILEYGSGFLSGIVQKDSMIFTTSFGLYSIKKINGQFQRKVFDIDRYNGIIYDSFRKRGIVFNKSKIATFNAEIKNIFDKQKLNAIGIKSLENLYIDQTNDNLFLKGYDNIVMYNPEADTGVSIFNNLRFKDEATVLLHRNLLVIAWKYGVLFSVIMGKMNLSDPLLYLNAHNNKYKTVYGASIVGEHLLLNTDNGLFEIDIPSTQQILAKQKSKLHDYHLIVNYDDSVRNTKNYDTIHMDQLSRKLVLDVIFLHRSGPLQYFCSFNNSSQFVELNANEINIPESFTPDNHYKLYIYVTDNSWKSNVIELNIYIKPYWWQTKIVKKLIWFGAIILAITIIFISILITRRLVLKAAEKRQLQMEMELKSIYAQINPHFIFNSLNSALLLVTKNRMDEAYSHISKFSHLLRSYLKSSRNKMITVEEEIENLKNYMELQQTRFKEKFLFEIIVDDNINQSSVKIPSLLLQPFVENAINHGITPKTQKGFIRIEFIQNKNENKITCTIDDDGIGRKKAEADKTSVQNKKESYGNLMIKDLVSIFSRYEGMTIDIKYTDKEAPLSGTIVTITIKYPHNEQ